MIIFVFISSLLLDINTKDDTTLTSAEAAFSLISSLVLPILNQE